jgi:outer membrane protein TolC
LREVCALVLVLLVAGCAALRPDSAVHPELSQASVSARVFIPPNLNVNPPETVVKPDAQGQVPANPQLPPELGGLQTTFTLSDAIAFALRNSPRLRSARADILRARGQERIAFAPFLPQVDFLQQTGVVSNTLAPGIPGNEGFIIPSGTGTRTYTQSEIGLEWTLYDCRPPGGSGSGRHNCAASAGHRAQRRRATFGSAALGEPRGPRRGAAR